MSKKIIQLCLLNILYPYKYIRFYAENDPIRLKNKDSQIPI